MPVTLSGSCHCGKVQFEVSSSTPVPYQVREYASQQAPKAYSGRIFDNGQFYSVRISICRKCGGSGGSINLGADANTLKILKGDEYIKKYHAVLNRGKEDERIATSERNFCGECSAMLWLFSPEWPELVHPFASAIDEPDLKPAENMVVVKLDSKPKWVRLPEGNRNDYQNYGPLSIKEWHKEHNETV